MTTKDIELKVQKVIQAQLVTDGLPGLQQTFGELGADSLDHIDLIMGLEDELGIEIDQDEYMDKVTADTTVEQVVQHLAKSMGAES